MALCHLSQSAVLLSLSHASALAPALASASAAFLPNMSSPSSPGASSYSSIIAVPEFWGEVQPPASLKGLDIPSRRADLVPWKPSRRRGCGRGNPTFSLRNQCCRRGCTSRRNPPRAGGGRHCFERNYRWRARLFHSDDHLRVQSDSRVGRTRRCSTAASAPELSTQTILR